MIPKQHEKYYSEQVIRLPDCYQCNDDKRKIDDSSTLGPKDPTEPGEICVLLFQQHLENYIQRIRHLDATTEKVQSSVLWLLADNNIVIENLKKEAKARDVDPTRIIFAEELTKQSISQGISGLTFSSTPLLIMLTQRHPMHSGQGCLF